MPSTGNLKLDGTTQRMCWSIGVNFIVHKYLLLNVLADFNIQSLCEPYESNMQPLFLARRDTDEFIYSNEVTLQTSSCRRK